MVKDALGHYNRYEVMTLTLADSDFIGTCLEGFFYGLYSGIFAMYIQGTSKKGTNKRINILFYTLCALYILSVVIGVVDIARFIYEFQGNQTANLHLKFLQGTAFACCDFMAQSILIYRCWIVWGCDIRVVILPSILAFVFLVSWLGGSSSQYILSPRHITVPYWGNCMVLAGITISMTVNALVTCLIAFKIFKFGRNWREKIRTVMFVLIESGMVLLSIQLARLVATIFISTDAGFKAFNIIVYIHQMLNGITPTIILVRVSMGLSFRDMESMMESTIASLHFVANNPHSISETETENVCIVNRDDDIGVQQSDDNRYRDGS
ncbi:hypothetical protein BYT27DRAFT_7255738 [Phlegmacium glaucopus]|nr:hypothetical protein BYT27DRAFT_7255738 [Phlegmacium glaucopus]